MADSLTVAPITAEQYPQMFAVAASLDMHVLTAPDFSDDEESPNLIGMLYYVGDRGDRSAGIFHTEITPMFKSPEELEKFCADNREEFDALAEMEAFPQKLFWEIEKR